MSADHTPCPWTMVEANATIPIVGANGRTVASVKYRANDFADASFIVRACNSHDAMLAALENLVTLDKQQMDDGVCGIKYHAALLAAETAIKLARGQS